MRDTDWNEVLFGLILGLIIISVGISIYFENGALLFIASGISILTCMIIHYIRYDNQR